MSNMNTDTQATVITPLRNDDFKKRRMRVSDAVLCIRKRIFLIFLCSLVGLGIGIVLSIVSYMRGEMSKQYAISTTMGITTQNTGGMFMTHSADPDASDIHLAQDMVDSVVYVIKSDKMLNKVIDNTDLLGVSTRDIANNLSLGKVSDTNIIEITLYWRSAQEGVQILEALNKVAPSVLIETLKIGGATVINDPKAKYLIGGNFNAALWGYMLILGAMMGIAIAVLEFFVRPTVLNTTDVEKDFHIEVLGEIPEKKKFFSQKRNLLETNEDDDLYPDVLDNYMSIAQIVKNRIRELDHPCIYVTSTSKNEGKTTVAAYVAADLSRIGLKVLLIDFDTRNPNLGGLFLGKTDYENSINALYRGESSKEEAIIKISNRLDILPAILEQKALPYDKALLDLIRELKYEYDVVIIDTAPVGQVADTMGLNELADLCLMVIRFDGAELGVIRDALIRLHKSGIEIMGCVVNAVRSIGVERTDSGNQFSRYSQIGKPGKKNKKSARKQEWEDWEKAHEGELSGSESQEAETSTGTSSAGTSSAGASSDDPTA